MTARPTIVDDGFIIDAETGEFLGMDEPKPLFVVEDEGGADWVLEKNMEDESAILALESQLAAIKSNIQSRIKRHRGRIEFRMLRCGPSLFAWARRKIEGGRAKSIQLTHGVIGFRKTQGSAEILDMDKAVRFVEIYNPGSVKKSVTITAVREALEKSEAGGYDLDGIPVFFRQSEAEDKPYVSTGLNKGDR